MTTEYFTLMSRYNRWMNQELLAVCSEMPDEIRRADRGAFFRSVHGTFNHVLVGDRLWLGRFTRVPFIPISLDQELCADWSELKRERAKTDDAIDAWLESVSDDELRAPFRYETFVNPEMRTYELWVLAAHFFNHQTHHRGQITTLMEQLGYDSGITDLVYMDNLRLD